MGIGKLRNEALKHKVMALVMIVLTLGIAACGSELKEIKEVHVAPEGSDESGNGSEKPQGKSCRQWVNTGAVRLTNCSTILKK